MPIGVPDVLILIVMGELENGVSLAEELFCMPTPDEVNFGDFNEVGYSFGMVRDLPVPEQIQALKARLYSRFINQVEPEDIKMIATEKGILFPKPFPLAIMCCVGFETLGNIFWGWQERKNERHYQFVEAIKAADPIFALEYSDEFQRQLMMLTGSSYDKISAVRNYGFLVYKFLRNPMLHSYRTNGVFLNHEWPVIMEADDSKGAILINPYRLWDAFKTLSDRLFNEAINNPASDYRIQCEQYLEEVLKEVGEV